MAGSSPANSLKIVCVGFVDILTSLSSKAIRESKSSAPGAMSHRSRPCWKLRYTTLQSSIPPVESSGTDAF